MYRVLYIAHEHTLSGANRSLLGLVKNIRKYNITPIVLVPQLGLLTDELNKENIEYIVSKYYWCYYPSNFKNWMYDKLKYVLNFYFHKKLLMKLKKSKIDLIHINCSVVIDTGIYLSKKLKLKNIVHIREYGYEDHRLRYRFGFKNLGKKLKNNQSNIIFISKHLKKYFDSYMGEIEQKNKIVIYNGIEKIKEIKEKKYGQNICIFGSVTKGKNQESIVRVVIKLLKDFPNLRLYIYGSGNKNYINYLKKIIIDNKYENKIFLMGNTNEPMEKMEKMDIGIMSSRCEAFGRVTVEYMMNKLAVIASNSGANSELIKDMENGLLYSFNKDKELEKKIRLLLTNEKILKKIANEGYKTAIQNFTADKNAKEIYEKVYKRLLNN